MTTTATYRELRRSRDDRMLAGVAGGLGHYFNVNPIFYRVGFVVLTLLGGAGLLIYGACVLVIPNEGARESIASDILRNHRQRPVALVGLALVAVAGIALLSHLSFSFRGDAFWFIVLVVGGALLLAQRSDVPPPPPQDGWASAPEPAVVAGPPRRRRRRGLGITLAAFGSLILAALVVAIVFVSIHMHLGDGVGDRRYEPANAAALRSDYHLGVGNLRLDLSDVKLPKTPTTIKLRLGIGALHVVVPRGVTVRTQTHVSWGDAELLGHEENGHNVRSDVGVKGARLVLDTQVGVGRVEVRRASAR